MRPTCLHKKNLATLIERTRVDNPQEPHREPRLGRFISRLGLPYLTCSDSLEYDLEEVGEREARGRVEDDATGERCGDGYSWAPSLCPVRRRLHRRAEEWIATKTVGLI